MLCYAERNLEPKTYSLERRTVQEPRPTDEQELVPTEPLIRSAGEPDGVAFIVIPFVATVRCMENHVLVVSFHL